MPRPTTGEAVRRQEAAAIQLEYFRAKNAGRVLSQAQLAEELDITQGAIAKWLTGCAPIPDKWLLWLGKRLGFDPYRVRPSLEIYKEIV